MILHTRGRGCLPSIALWRTTSHKKPRYFCHNSFINFNIPRDWTPVTSHVDHHGKRGSSVPVQASSRTTSMILLVSLRSNPTIGKRGPVKFGDAGITHCVIQWVAHHPKKNNTLDGNPGSLPIQQPRRLSLEFLPITYSHSVHLLSGPHLLCPVSQQT